MARPRGREPRDRRTAAPWSAAQRRGPPARAPPGPWPPLMPRRGVRQDRRALCESFGCLACVRGLALAPVC